MPEVGNMPLPAELLTRGVRDMVRISDARMSGTASERWFCTWSRRRRPAAH
jgi:dihydroxyacid dehydratase/phosphogluconate dehydratase